MNDEIDLLRPRLVIPVGKLAIAQFLPFEKLDEVVGRNFTIRDKRRAFDLIPLPHPSGASPWHRIPPGLGLLGRAMRRIARHPAIEALAKDRRS
jgi:uracil-DNA glycosylase